MTGSGPLSEAELEADTALHTRRDGLRDTGYCAHCGSEWPCLTARLVADLHAKDAELERLRSQLTEARQDARENYARAEQAEQALQRTKGAAQFVPPAPPALTDNAGLVWQAGYRAACERIRRGAPTLT